jgi:hypothetical protein
MIKFKDFNTKEFYLAALLISYNGFVLSGSVKKNDGVYFLVKYKDEEFLQDLLNKFRSYTAMVNLSKLKTSLTKLRKELDKYKF